MKTKVNHNAALGRLLRRSAPRPQLLPDATYNAQILAAIRTEIALGSTRTLTNRPRSIFLRLREFAVLAAACAASACAVLYGVRTLQRSPTPEIVSVRVSDLRVAASAVGDEDGMPVLWITGMRPLSETEFRLRPKRQIN